MKKFILIAIEVLVVTLVCNAQTAAFHEDGIASWYGTEFDGQTTASGEIFNSNDYTAAHPNLPFGALLTITNKNNNKKVTVRVNDRGPFISNRNIDLSKAAAEQLDMIASGAVPVSIDSAEAGATPGPVGAAVVAAPPLPAAPPPQQPAATPFDPQTPPPSAPPVAAIPPAAVAPPSDAPASPPPATPQQPAAQPSAPLVAPIPPVAVAPPPAKPASIKPAIPPAGTNKRYRLQIGAFRVPKNAVSVFEKLKSVGLEPAYERSGDLYRVVLSGIRADDVQAVAEKIGRAGFTEALIREEP
ncbi:MAG: septal ring lytic transglycosylase RlpA family protein [Treponema sp.]|nr:septal ring lytic transglycosylase RlpA family protein [Treponema sp.]